MERAYAGLPPRFGAVTGPGVVRSLWHKLVAGGEARKSRLHDELGRRADTAFVIRNGPRAMASGLVRLATGHLPARPWISYEAQRVLATFLASKTCRVLEFGSGQSSHWYAARASSLVSIEENAAWHARVAPQLAAVPNTDYRLVAVTDGYSTPQVDGVFDLVMIDGAKREECARFALERLAPGGIIYLDNADKSASPATGDIPKARALLIEHAEKNGWQWREFTDFAPAQMFVQRGLMVRQPVA